MSITEKLTTIVNNMQRIYNSGHTNGYNAGVEEGKNMGQGGDFDAGKLAGQQQLWDAVQNHGNRTKYLYAFYGWDLSMFYPKYDIIATGRFDQVFNTSTSEHPLNLTARLAECGVTLDTSAATSFSYSFFGSPITHIPKIDTTNASTLEGTFTNNANIITIDELVLKEDGSQTFTSVFDWSYNLENIIVSGTIGKNGFSLTGCSKLTRESLLSIINALQDKTSDTSGTQWVVTFGSSNKAKLTAEELAIAEDKGWTVV